MNVLPAPLLDRPGAELLAQAFSPFLADERCRRQEFYDLITEDD